MTELIITEKPQAAEKIATALADTKAIKKEHNKIAYYELTHKGKKILVGCAVGHLFTISEKVKNASYPVFEVEWKPNHLKSKSSFSKKYLDALKFISKQADEVTVACDYDLEGSVIGYNVVRFIVNKKDGKRMKFSTLTKDELVEAYEKASKTLDFPQIEAGETRHMLDYFYGISTSRALTNSIKQATNGFKLMSTGRVQGPTLKLIVDRELEIKKFVPEPYFELELTTEKDKKKIVAQHEQGKFTDKKEATKIYDKTKGKKALVKNIKKEQAKVLPPSPFDLTTLQTEAFATLRLKPKDTLSTAQSLYLAGLISYPRTSSQQLPKSIDYKKIITSLSKQTIYKKYCSDLLKGTLSPNNGKKSDPAHPAIYPTGEVKQLSGAEAKLYDLIVRRTLATFSNNSVRETQQVKIDVNNENFITSGTVTIKKGWQEVYQPYLRLKEIELPELKIKEELKVISLNLLEKETQPPKRFTQASIIKKMESLGLGTKATRSTIVETLYDRGYVSETSLEATNLGIKVIETLNKYCEEIIDVKLTRHFEKEMEEIQDGKRKETQVLSEAKKTLTKIFDHFKKNELKIGKELSEANKATLKEASIIGKCNKCTNDLQIRYSPKNKSYFIGCSGYPNCNNMFPVPKNALIKATGTTCKECGYPEVKVIRKGKRPFNYCINTECKLKKEYYEKINKVKNE